MARQSPSRRWLDEHPSDRQSLLACRCYAVRALIRSSSLARWRRLGALNSPRALATVPSPPASPSHPLRSPGWFSRSLSDAKSISRGSPRDLAGAAGVPAINPQHTRFPVSRLVRKFHDVLSTCCSPRNLGGTSSPASLTSDILEKDEFACLVIGGPPWRAGSVQMLRRIHRRRPYLIRRLMSLS